MGDAVSTDSDSDDGASGAAPTLPANAVSSAISPGSMISRFRVESIVGAGGMGRVYAAHDAELDRRIALKLLHDDAFSARARARFLREARVMAKLRHPNVVTIHEVGEASGRPFIAMELVDGRTLADWSRAKKRSWREIRDVFVAAGRGLIAAHDAHLVHRDFKPSNVMVGERAVQVLDFGLAFELGDVPELAAGSTSSADVQLTRTGALVGTLPYMSPEQIAGTSVTERSDQWAFCVALFESFAGVLPFSGSSSERLAAMARGVAPPPQAPRFIARLLRRGLAFDPADRYPSMRALLADLDRDPRRWGLAAVAIAIAGAATFALWPRAHDVCAIAGLDGAWDTTARVRLDAAFVSTGAPYAADVFARVSSHLDSYARRWTLGRSEACTARDGESASLFDRRVQCLGSLRDELASTVTAMIASPKLTRAVATASALGDVADCADAKALLEGPPRPTDPDLRATIANLERKLDDAVALGRLGDPVTAATTIGALVPAVEAVPYKLLEAKTLYWWGRMLALSDHTDEGIVHLDRAIQLAEELGDAKLAAKIWVIRVQALADHRDYAETDRLMLAARSALRRVGSPASLVGELDVAAAAAELGRDHLDKATNLLADALSHLTGSDDGADRGRVYAMLGQIASMRQDYVALADAATKLAETATQTVGPDHPLAGEAHAQLGAALIGKGDFVGAERELATCVTIWRRVIGPTSAEAANCIQTIAIARAQAGRLDTALAAIDEAISIYGATPTRRLVNALDMRGNIMQSLGRVDEARSAFERVLELRRQLFGDNSADVAMSYRALGSLDLDAHPDKAIPQFEHAVAIYDHEHVTGTLLADALLDLATANLDAHHDSAALQNLDRARPQLSNADPSSKALAEFLRARVTWDLGQHEPAVALARSISCEHVAKELWDEIAVWLKKR